MKVVSNRYSQHAQSQSIMQVVEQKYLSQHLGREVVYSLLVPLQNEVEWNLLLLNDGQDIEGLQLFKHLQRLLAKGEIKATLVVAVHSANRLQEYGVAGNPDYQQRGAKAGDYTAFIMHELLPFLDDFYAISKNPENRVVAGCSLGGLSAFDLAWNHPAEFGKVGVFSGSFWWRKKALDAGYTDADRIAHHMVRVGKPGKKLEFWFEAGTDDETSDRNNNGIIDSIEDTMDLITELVLKGYELNRQVKYVEVKGGKHDLATWSEILPQFLKWALK